MLIELASHNEAIRRLLEKGYALRYDSDYLVVRDIPYLDSQLAVQVGAIVTKLVFSASRLTIDILPPAPTESPIAKAEGR